MYIELVLTLTFHISRRGNSSKQQRNLQVLDSNTVRLKEEEKNQEKALYHLPEFLRAKENIISYDCSTNLHHVDSTYEKEDLAEMFQV